MTIKQKIKFHKDNKYYTRISREVGEGYIELNRGYIVDYSKDFIIVHETDDFKVLGYIVFPINQIKELRYNNDDKFYNKMMIWEKEYDKVGIPYKINLSDWQSMFKSIKTLDLGVIVECEHPKIETFTIGPIIKASKTAVHILYFNAKGISDEKPTSVAYNEISKVMFDDRYVNVFSKYLRQRKKRVSKTK